VNFGVPQSAKLLFQIMLVRVRVSIQPEEVNVCVIICMTVDGSAVALECQARSVRVLVRIE